jgi:hypothetical protein
MVAVPAVGMAQDADAPLVLTNDYVFNDDQFGRFRNGAM